MEIDELRQQPTRLELRSRYPAGQHFSSANRLHSGHGITSVRLKRKQLQLAQRPWSTSTPWFLGNRSAIRLHMRLSGARSEVEEYLLDYLGILDAGDDPYCPAADRPCSSDTSMYATGSRQPAVVHFAAPADLSMSMPKTRSRHCAQVIEARRSAGVGFAESSLVPCLPPLPRSAGVARARCLLFGANTPW